MKVNNTVLSKNWAKEEIMKGNLKFLELNENKNTTSMRYMKADKKFIALRAHIKKLT